MANHNLIKRQSVALMIIGLGLIGTPETGRLEAREVHDSNSDTPAVTVQFQSSEADEADHLTDSDAAYVQAMKKHLGSI